MDRRRLDVTLAAQASTTAAVEADQRARHTLLALHENIAMFGDRQTATRNKATKKDEEIGASGTSGRR